MCLCDANHLFEIMFSFMGSYEFLSIPHLLICQLTGESLGVYELMFKVF